MFKTVTFKCEKCGKTHSFNIGSCEIATLQDAISILPQRDADKLLESVNKMLINKTEAQRTSFMMNNADGLSMVNYDACGAYINLFEANDIKDIFGKYKPEHIERLNKSMALWETAKNADGFIAFKAMFYCRKCKKLLQGMFLKIRSVEDKKERAYVYNERCQRCNNELVLVNDANMGYMFEGLTARAPCPECGGSLTVTDVRFKP